MNAASLFSPAAAAATWNGSGREDDMCSPQEHVGERAESAVGMSDDEREDAIKRAGDLMERRYADFARTGFLADLGDAHRAMLLMQELVKGRSKTQVLKMEIREGLI